MDKSSGFMGDTSANTIERKSVGQLSTVPGRFVSYFTILFQGRGEGGRMYPWWSLCTLYQLASQVQLP